MRLPPAVSPRVLGIAFASASFATLATLAAVGLAGLIGIHRDPCAIPAGLAPAAQASIASHAMACRNLEEKRISLAEYRRLVGVDQPPSPQWASTLIAFSSEYSTSSWSASQVLGAPNVYPHSGDDWKAWAPRDADGAEEYVEVGFDEPMRASGLDIYQTYNPGAIARVELIPLQGTRIPIAVGQERVTRSSMSAISHLTTSCTTDLIVGARITLRTDKVAGWNEIDAIRLVPCR